MWVGDESQIELRFDVGAIFAGFRTILWLGVREILASGWASPDWVDAKLAATSPFSLPFHLSLVILVNSNCYGGRGCIDCSSSLQYLRVPTALLISNMDIARTGAEPVVVKFYRQYMQQINELSYPPGPLLLKPDVQTCLYRYFFDASQNKFLPPTRYQTKVLRQIIKEIERSMKDPEEDVGQLQRSACYLLPGYRLRAGSRMTILGLRQLTANPATASLGPII